MATNTNNAKNTNDRDRAADLLLAENAANLPTCTYRKLGKGDAALWAIVGPIDELNEAATAGAGSVLTSRGEVQYVTLTGWVDQNGTPGAVVWDAWNTNGADPTTPVRVGAATVEKLNVPAKRNTDRPSWSFVDPAEKAKRQAERAAASKAAVAAVQADPTAVLSAMDPAKLAEVLAAAGLTVVAASEAPAEVAPAPEVAEVAPAPAPAPTVAPIKSTSKGATSKAKAPAAPVVDTSSDEARELLGTLG